MNLKHKGGQISTGDMPMLSFSMFDSLLFLRFFSQHRSCFGGICQIYSFMPYPQHSFPFWYIWLCRHFSLGQHSIK